MRELKVRKGDFLYWNSTPDRESYTYYPAISIDYIIEINNIAGFRDNIYGLILNLNTNEITVEEWSINSNCDDNKYYTIIDENDPKWADQINAIRAEAIRLTFEKKL